MPENHFVQHRISLIRTKSQFIFRKSTQILILLFSLHFLYCASSRPTRPAEANNFSGQLQQIIDTIKQKYCPDTRLAAFNIQGNLKGNLIQLKGETSSREAFHELNSQFKKLAEYDLKNDIEILPTKALGKDTCGIIRISVANLHEGTLITTNLVNQALMGSKVKILKQKGGSYLGQLEDGYLGWIDTIVLTVGTDSIYREWDRLEKVVVIAFWGLVNAEKNENSPAITDIVFGDELAFGATEEDWVKIQLPDKRTGYVKTDLVIEKKKWYNMPAATPEDITQSALKLKGFPYLWGGTSIKAMDCSGFTGTVYRMNRIILPRDANMQVNIGAEVAITENFENLKPADLLFFGAKKDRITHVGIYLGNFQFIHSEGLVRQDSFNAADANFYPYRLRTLQRVKRIVN
ncbi:C40 family peptidase [candidate division KSB1 bacterium]|nr:C40 family peptidase [candidate division KSB1 bacterium]